MRSKRTVTREARLHSIGAFYNQADRFAETCRNKKKIQRIRTFAQEYHSDLQFVLRLLARMPGTNVVIHGPRGCLSLLPRDMGAGAERSCWAVTNLDERDVILGGETKLRGAIRQLCGRAHPKRVFVVTTPPVSINNDDAEALAAELEEELDVSIVVIPATGFRSKLGVMGYDEAQDALSLLLPPPSERPAEPYVNLISISESARDVGDAGQFLNRLGFAVNVLPNFSGERQLTLASGARASLELNHEEGGRLAAFLSDRYGVPAFSPAPPVGFEGTTVWERAVADALGTGGAALEYTGGAQPENSDALRGLNLYLLLDPWYVAPCKAFFESLGATVCGVTVPFLDEGAPALDALTGEDAPPVHVAQGQGFELLKILERTAPDMVVCQHTPSRAPLSGVPCVSLEQTGLFGRAAAARLLRAVTGARENAGFFHTLESNGAALYRPTWMKKSVDWHIKLEVS